MVVNQPAWLGRGDPQTGEFEMKNAVIPAEPGWYLAAAKLHEPRQVGQPVPIVAWHIKSVDGVMRAIPVTIDPEMNTYSAWVIKREHESYWVTVCLTMGQHSNTWRHKN